MCDANLKHHFCRGDGANKIFLVLFGILLVYVIFWVGSLIRNNFQEYKFIGKADQQQRLINIQAQGKVTAKPDVASLSMGVVSEGKSVEEAQTKNTGVMNNFVDRLKALGIAEDDIKTSNYSVYPMYDYNQDGRVFKGYEVSQDLTVKIRNLDNSGKVLALAGELGINRVGGISFTIDDPEVYKEQARQLALENARKKAVSISKMIGVDLVSVVSYNEYESGVNFDQYASAKMEYGMGGGSPVPQVETGSMDVLMNVNITFEVK